jgi:hypothetical protein
MRTKRCTPSCGGLFFSLYSVARRNRVILVVMPECWSHTDVMVSAQRSSVSALHKNATAFIAFRSGRNRPINKDRLAAFDRVAISLQSTASESIEIEQTDLTEVHSLSDAYARIACSRMRKVVQVHCIAAYLAAATPILLPDLVTFIAAPIVLPFYFFSFVPVDAFVTWITGGRLFGNDAVIFWIATHLSLRYTLFCGPSYFIARDMRYRELTLPAYVVSAILIIGWPLYHMYWFWSAAA